MVTLFCELSAPDCSLYQPFAVASILLHFALPAPTCYRDTGMRPQLIVLLHQREEHVKRKEFKLTKSCPSFFTGRSWSLKKTKDQSKATTQWHCPDVKPHLLALFIYHLKNLIICSLWLELCPLILEVECDFLHSPPWLQVINSTDWFQKCISERLISSVCQFPTSSF